MSTDYEIDELIVAGAKVRLRRTGAGRSLLFLHGLGGAMTPLPFFDELAKEWAVLIPDHPGFGHFDTPPWLFGIGDVAYCYLDLIDQLGLREVDVVGHSLGGWIAAEIAIRNADAIRSLTLIAPAGVRTKGSLSGDFFLWSPEERAYNLFHDQQLASKYLAASSEPALLETQLKNNYAAARIAWQPRFYNPELQRWLHRIKVPVQLIWGEQDRLMPVTFAKVWMDALSKAQFSKLPQCGHLPHVEQPAETLSVMRSFWREVAS